MRRSILIADDSVTIRRVVELAFSDTDIRVEAAGNGTEALAKIATLAPDLILADVVMPAPDGYEICRVVKSSDRPVPVLLLAGTFEPLDPEHARDCGADGHMVKPFDSRLLVAQVARLLEAGPAPSGTAKPGATAAVSAPASEEDDLEDVFDELAGVAGPESAVPPVPAADPETARIDAIVALVLERLSDRVVREIAWDVVPDLAETIIRERLREIERGDEVD